MARVAYCPRCGKKNGASADWCSACGTPLDEDDLEEEAQEFDLEDDDEAEDKPEDKPGPDDKPTEHEREEAAEEPGETPEHEHAEHTETLEERAEGDKGEHGHKVDNPGGEHVHREPDGAGGEERPKAERLERSAPAAPVIVPPERTKPSAPWRR